MAICRRYSINDFDAADVLNDGFLKVFTHIEKYDSTKPFKSWLGRIITNTAIDHYRTNLKFSDHDDVSTHEDIGHVAAVYDRLAYQDLLALVQSLSPAYRTVFNLYAIDGYSHEEIAQMLKISVGTSKSNLFKARLKLQEKLAASNIRKPPAKKNDLKIDSDSAIDDDQVYVNETVISIPLTNSNEYDDSFTTDQKQIYPDENIVNAPVANSDVQSNDEFINTKENMNTDFNINTDGKG